MLTSTSVFIVLIDDVEPLSAPLSTTHSIFIYLLRIWVSIFATAELGISDFACRIIALLDPVVSCMDSKDVVHGLGAQARPWWETVYLEECIYTAFCTAIALHSIHLFQSHCTVFSPTHPYLYILRSHSRSIPNRYGSLRSVVVLGQNMHLQAIPRPTHGNEIVRLQSQLPSVCI